MIADVTNPFCRTSKKGGTKDTQPLDIDVVYPFCDKVKDCEKDKEDCETNKQKCEDKVKDCEKGKKDCEINRQKCEDKVKNCEKDKKDCETNRRECENKIRDCKIEKDRCDGEKQQLIRDIERCKIEKDRCGKEALELERKIKCCKAEKEGCDKEKRQLESKIYDLEGEKLKLGRDIERCKTEKTECGKETLKLESKIKCFKAEKEECDEEKQQLKSKIRGLEDEKYDRDTEIMRLKRDIERCKEEKGEYADTEENNVKISFGPAKMEEGDCEYLKTLRDGVDSLVVTSVKTGERVGSANISYWYFQDDKLHCSKQDNIEKDIVYLKVLPSNKLGLCDKDGNVVSDDISKCNIVGGERIELRDYFREDGKPAFILKPSKSEDFGEKCGNKYRAEIYKYNPDSDDSGDIIGHLNAVAIKAINDHSLLAKTQLVDRDRVSDFATDKKNTITIVEKSGEYQLDNPMFEDMEAHVKSNEQTTKFIIDEVLCLCDRSILQDGVQIIG